MNAGLGSEDNKMPLYYVAIAKGRSECRPRNMRLPTHKKESTVTPCIMRGLDVVVRVPLEHRADLELRPGEKGDRPGAPFQAATSTGHVKESKLRSCCQW